MLDCRFIMVSHNCLFSGAKRMLTFANIGVDLHSRFLRNNALREVDPLLFFVDVDMQLSTEFFRRCRANAAAGRQVYFPTVWSFYKGWCIVCLFVCLFVRIPPFPVPPKSATSVSNPHRNIAFLNRSRNSQLCLTPQLSVVVVSQNKRNFTVSVRTAFNVLDHTTTCRPVRITT
jgi:hypothetical protein